MLLHESKCYISKMFLQKHLRVPCSCWLSSTCFSYEAEQMALVARSGEKSITTFHSSRTKVFRTRFTNALVQSHKKTSASLPAFSSFQTRNLTWQQSRLLAKTAMSAASSVTLLRWVVKYCWILAWHFSDLQLAFTSRTLCLLAAAQRMHMQLAFFFFWRETYHAALSSILNKKIKI